MGKSNSNRKAGKCLSLDLFFGHPVQINYSGEATYKTYCGALSSILIIVCLVAFTAVQFKLFYVRYFEVRQVGASLRDTQVSTVTTYDADLLREGYQLDTSDQLFQVALGIKQVKDFDYSGVIDDWDLDAMLDPRIGSLKVQLIEYVTDTYDQEQTRVVRDLILADCPYATPSSLRKIQCVVFNQRRQDNSLDTESQFGLFGAHDGQQSDFSYLRLTVHSCEDRQLQEATGDSEARCFPKTGSEFYLNSIRLQLFITDSFVDYSGAREDNFYQVSTKTRLVSSQRLNPETSQHQMHTLQLNRVGYTTMSVLQVQDSLNHLRLVSSATSATEGLAEDLALRHSAAEEEEALLSSHFITLDQQVAIVQLVAEEFVPLAFLVQVGGLFVSLVGIGHLMTRLTAAKTLFLVSFTEDVFQQAANSTSKFDSEETPNSSVKPLRGTAAAQAPKMQLLDKISRMCSFSSPPEKLAAIDETLTKDDTDVMWNEFLRFRKRIKYNVMGVVLCCCTRRCRAKADTELYKQLLIKSSEDKLVRALDIRSLFRTNKYLRLFMNATLSEQGRFLIRNQQSQLLRLQSQIFSESEDDLTLSEPENDIHANLNALHEFVPEGRAERTLLEGFLQRQKTKNVIDEEGLNLEPSSFHDNPVNRKSRTTSGKSSNKKRSGSSTRPLPPMKAEPAEEDDLEPRDSHTASDHGIDDQFVENGFVKVHNEGLKQEKRRAGLVSSYSQGANKQIEEDKEDDAVINEYMDKIPLNNSLKDGERHGVGGFSLPKTPQTDTKEKSGGGDWQDPYQNAIGTKLTQLRIMNAPVLEAGSDGGGSAVELNKLSNLLEKW